MTPRIKAGNICQLSDARYLNALEADILLTFSFDALDPAAMTTSQAAEMIRWLYEPAVVAAFSLHQDEAEIRFVLDSIGASAIQVPETHPLAKASSTWHTFILHPILSPGKIPDLPHHEALFHILDLRAGSISLKELYHHPMFPKWKQLTQQEHVFLRVLPGDYTLDWQHLWQPYGWDIVVPGSGSNDNLVDMYGDFLEGI